MGFQRPFLGLVLISLLPGCAPGPGLPAAERPGDVLLAVGLSAGPALEDGLRPLAERIGITLRTGWRDPSGCSALELRGFVVLARHAGRPSLVLAQVLEWQTFLDWQRRLGRLVTQAGGRTRIFRAVVAPYDLYRRGSQALPPADGLEEPEGEWVLELWRRGALLATALEPDVLPAEAAWALERLEAETGGEARGRASAWLLFSPRAYQRSQGSRGDGADFFHGALEGAPLAPERREALARVLAQSEVVEARVELDPESVQLRLRVQPAAGTPEGCALLGPMLQQGWPADLRLETREGWVELEGRLGHSALHELLGLPPAVP